MKIRAKVKFREGRNAECLIRAFFKNFNSKSSIVVRGNEANIEIVFDNIPSLEIIEAISYCDILELYYGKDFTQHYDEEICKAEEISEEAVKDDVNKIFEEIESEKIENTKSEEAEILENLEKENIEESKEIASKEVVSNFSMQEIEKKDQKKTDENIKSIVNDENLVSEIVENKKNDEKTKNSKFRRGRPAIQKLQEVKIPEIEKLLEKATSFKEFISLVEEYLELNNDKTFFRCLVYASTQSDVFSWSELRKVLKTQDVYFNEGKKVRIAKKVSEKFEEYSMTLLPFIANLRKYENYTFTNTKSETDDNKKLSIVNLENDFDETKKNLQKLRVKMECMPVIPSFEEVLGSIDKTLSIERRVSYVLTAMGLEKLSKDDQQDICKITIIAVKLHKMSFESIFSKSSISLENKIKVRMKFSEFIDNFVKKYDCTKKVKVLDFLEQLQRIIMLENEIENSEDSAD